MKLQPQLHLGALSVSVARVAMAFWLYACGRLWPYQLDIDKKEPPSHLFDLSGATYIYKYYRV